MRENKHLYTEFEHLHIEFEHLYIEFEHLYIEFEESDTYFCAAGARDVPNFSCYQEETETCLFLHINYKTDEPSCTRKFIIHKPDTYIFHV